MNSRKNIIAIFSQLPLPEFAGDRQMVNNHLKNLSNHYNVYAVIICLEEPTNEVHNFLKQHTSNYKIFQLSKLQMIFNSLTGIIKLQSLQVSLFYSNKIQSYIDNQLFEMDFIFCCNIRTSKYVLTSPLPKFIDFIDSISLNYKRSQKNVKSFFWKLIYWYETPRLYKYEEKIINSFDSSFVVNYNEMQYWSSKLNIDKIIWLPNGIKNHLFSYNKQVENWHKKSIVFLGKMDYPPNVDAVLWFIDEVYPYLDKDIQFFIIGARTNQNIINKAEAYKNIIIKGYLEDPYLIVNSCNVVISPMQTGGGVQNKILEGMALGKVNVTTKLGANSIRFAQNGIHLLVEDNAEKMAELINQICNMPENYFGIGAKARDLVKDIYTWEKHGDTMIKKIESSLSNKNDISNL